MAMIIDFDPKSDLGFPFWTPVRRRFNPDSPFFASGNVERELLAKQVALDLSEDEKFGLQNLVVENCRHTANLCLSCIREVFCPIVGCGARLHTLEVFEEHYSARHTASCSVCSRVYPTSRLVSIHVSEAHDSFFQTKVPRGYAMYECLVEGCVLKFKNYKSRQQHLMDKHRFPSSFDFFKKANPSKKSRQKHSRTKEATRGREDASSRMEVEGETIDNLVSAVSRLTTSDSCPSSISFGHRHTRGLTFVPLAVQRERRPDSTVTRP